MRKTLSIFIVIILVTLLVGCADTSNVAKNETNENILNEDTAKTISVSGVIENIIVFNTYKEITITTGQEQKTFRLKNSTHLFDNSHNPKVEPYLTVGTYVDIEIEENEYNKNKPAIRRITITSYDGIFTA